MPGQWVLIGGDAPAGVPPLDAGPGIFAEATGVDIADAGVQTRFGLQPAVVKVMSDRDYAPLTVLYLAAGASSLAALADEINGNLAQQRASGTLIQATVVSLPEALTMIGPVPKPQGGWRQVIVDQYYGGRLPGPMDTTFPTLVQQLAARSQEPADRFAIALREVP